MRSGKFFSSVALVFSSFFPLLFFLSPLSSSVVGLDLFLPSLKVSLFYRSVVRRCTYSSGVFRKTQQTSSRTVEVETSSSNFFFTLLFSELFLFSAAVSTRTALRHRRVGHPPPIFHSRFRVFFKTVSLLPAFSVAFLSCFLSFLQNLCPLPLSYQSFFAPPAFYLFFTSSRWSLYCCE